MEVAASSQKQSNQSCLQPSLEPSAAVLRKCKEVLTLPKQPLNTSHLKLDVCHSPPLMSVLPSCLCLVLSVPFSAFLSSAFSPCLFTGFLLLFPPPYVP